MLSPHSLIFYFLLITIGLGTSAPAIAENRTVDLEVDYKTVNFTGKSAQALAINNQIPGPTLHFKEGDQVTINVKNHLDVGTSLHWHGLIVPWEMDGVSEVSQKPIPPGGIFHYQFTVKQAGSYWYHAHNGLQEQQGAYGGIIIDPIKPSIKSDKDFTVILSDWNNADPETVYANLKREGDYYSKAMPLQPSLVRFWKDYSAAPTPQAKADLRTAYQGMQKMRMSIYDISDIKYDAFLLNGHPASEPWTTQVQMGDTVRLRFVGAGASTYFNVKIPNHALTIVQVDGQDIKPYTKDSLMIAPGETYDVLITITKDSPTIIYTQSTDKSGVALGALLTHINQVVDYSAVVPFADPAPVTMMSHGMMIGMSDEQERERPKKTMMMDHDRHIEKLADAPSVSSPTQYDPLQSTSKTNDPSLPVEVIGIDLTGYMDRYVWFLNGVTEAQAKPMLIEHGKRYRIIFTNKTMMHHPMHIHGHWFILRNGHGAYDPLLHTIDVPPGATVIADFDADTSGQWFFHCHNLFHMKAGMANIFRYQENEVMNEDMSHVMPVADSTPTPKQQAATIEPYLPGHKQVPWYYSQELEISGDIENEIYQGTVATLIGSDINKLQLNMEDAEINHGTVDEANIDLFGWRLVDQFWAVKGGINYTYRPASTPYFQPGVGIEGLMPYFIQTDLRTYYHNGSTKLDVSLARDTQLTNRFYLRAALESIFATKTVDEDEIGSGLNSLEWTLRPYYQVTSNFSLYWQYQYTHNYSSLKRLQEDSGEPTTESIYSIGFSWLI